MYLEEVETELTMLKLSEGTQHGCQIGWRQGVLYCKQQQRDPFPQGRSREEKGADEDLLLTFVAMLGRIMGRTDGTVKQTLFEIGYAYMLFGFPDPSLHRARLWKAVGGRQRWRGAPKRKMPATPKMLEWVQNYLLDAKQPKLDADIKTAAPSPAYAKWRCEEPVVECRCAVAQWEEMAPGTAACNEAHCRNRDSVGAWVLLNLKDTRDWFTRVARIQAQEDETLESLQNDREDTAEDHTRLVLGAARLWQEHRLWTQRIAEKQRNDFWSQAAAKRGGTRRDTLDYGELVYQAT